MKPKKLQIHCIFTPAGEPFQQLVLRSFSLYLHRILAEADDLEA